MSILFKPLYDRVLLRRIEGDDKTKGGLFIPDTAKEKPLEGEIVALGVGKLLDNGTIRQLSVKIGDRVLFAKYSETEIQLDGQSFVLIKEDDLLGILSSHS